MKINVDYNRIDAKRYIFDTEVNNIKDVMLGEFLNPEQKIYRLCSADGEKIKCEKRVVLNYIKKKLARIKLLSEGYVELTSEMFPNCSPNQFINKDGAFVKINNKSYNIVVSTDGNFVRMSCGRISNFVKRQSVVNMAFYKKEQLLAEGFIYLNGFKDVKSNLYLVNNEGVIYSLTRRSIMNNLSNGYNLRCNKITRDYYRIQELVKFYNDRMGEVNAH